MGTLKDRMNADLVRYGLSASGRKAYLRCLESYARYFKRSPSRLGANDIEGYLDYVEKTKKRSLNFRQMTFTALRFLYFVTLDRPEAMARFLSPVKQKPAPNPLSSIDLDCLLQNIPSPLHKTILTVSISGGMWLSETCSLRAGDIDSRRMLIHLSSKDDSWPKFIPLHCETLQTLRKWWSITRPQTDMIFGACENYAPITPAQVKSVLRQTAVRCGLEYAVDDTTLRYSFFMHRLSACTHPREIMHLLRCTSIRPTPSSILRHSAAARAVQGTIEKGVRI